MGKTWDWSLFLTIIAIGLISLSTLYSLSVSHFQNQLMFWGIGLIVLWFASYFDTGQIKKVAAPAYIFSLLVLAILLIVSEPVRGATRWFDFGFVRIQPSEITKAAVIVVLAVFFQNKSAKQLKNLLFGFLLILPSIILIVIQPDIGSTLPIIAILLGIAIAAGLKLKDLITILFLCAVGGILLFELLVPYQKDRLITFFNPALDPLGTGYHIIQSKIAVGSGQLFGRGLSQGSQSQLAFLPEAESDFIFAATSEQFGFLGSGILLFLFLLLLLKLLKISQLQKSNFSKYLGLGIFSYLLIQILVNVGMNIGLLPVTGITLPLVSYGGSSLVTTLLLLGLIFSLERYKIV